MIAYHTGCPNNDSEIKKNLILHTERNEKERIFKVDFLENELIICSVTYISYISF